MRRERENAQRIAEESRRAHERQDAEAREKASRRRAILQKVKDETTSDWRLPLSNRPDLKAQALKAIETELSALPVEDLPHSELLLIAEGARDRLYREPLAAQRRAQANAANRERMIRHGKDYADRKLRATEGLSLSERWALERRVREELEAATGEETPAEIEDWVDEILEANGIGWDEDDDDA